MKPARDLHPIPLADVLPLGSHPALVVTMAQGQWDSLLAAAYQEGCVLLELDEHAQPVKVYRKSE